MDARYTFIIGGIALGLIALWAVWWGIANLSPNGNATTTPNPTSTPPTATSTAVSRVMLAFLDINDTSTSTKERGCDRVVMVPWTIPTTTMPLSGALAALFTISTTTVNGYFNFIDRTNETLRFQRASVDSAGTAHIYLTGTHTGLAGVCDDPRAAIQIEETALQFPTVQRVQLYLNNASTTLIPSER